VTILVDNLESIDHFRLHVKQMTVDSATVHHAGSDMVDLMEAFEYPPNEYYVLRSKNSFPKGKYTIDMEFHGNLTGLIVGFYQAEYINSEGEKVPMATSKFQPTDARSAFPCFDEPSYKSTFSTTLVRPSERYVALSNMPEERQVQDSPRPGLTEVTFQKSVPMVTYLACFIVCDFEFAEKYTKRHGTKFRVYATPNQKENVQYALDIGANITDFFTDYFDVAYPLPKQDMIAIPDFISGAMEHWGLITYREIYLLYNDREASSSNKQRVATIVSHELAHQWFGNLMTLSWWDDLWLNEGFASYIEYKGVAQYHTDWDMEAQFLVEDLHPVMDLDSTLNSHPIVQPVDHPNQITEIFDAISYKKGASVLRMLEQFLGPDDFRRGVSKFLKAYKYSNAQTRDLWLELEETSSKGYNVTKIMDTWTRQKGYPVVEATRVNPTHYRLHQKRYLIDSDQGNEDEEEHNPLGYKWDIPLTWFSDKGSKKVEQKWLLSSDGYVDVKVDATATFVKFNVGQFGFYRVNYPKEEWIRFSKVLQEDHAQFSTMDRAHLLNDAFALAESGHVDYSVPLSMTRYLRLEADYVPWRTAYKALTRVESRIRDTEAYPSFRKYILALVAEPYNNFGWNDDGGHLKRLARVSVLNLACRNGHTGCIEEAGKRFANWISDAKNYVPPNLRNLVYRYGMGARGDSAAWDEMLIRFMAEENPAEKRKLLYGLAFAREPWILSQFLNLSGNETIVRQQDFFTAVRYVATNPVGNSLAWDYVRSNWESLIERFTLNNRYLGRLPGQVVSKFVSRFKRGEVEAFFNKYPEGGAGTRSRKQALEKIDTNIKWLEKHQVTIKRWLDRNA